MGITDNAALGATKQDVISALVARELAAQAKLMATVTDVSMHAVAGAKSVSFPKSGSFTVENRASGAQGTTQNLTYANDKLDLDFRAHIQWIIEDMDAYQSKVDVKVDYIKKATAAHARKVDSELLAKLLANAGQVEAGAIDKAKILNGVQFLDQNFATDEDRYLVINPASRNAMLSIADFVRADALGFSNIPKGMIGQVFGLNVIVHAAAAHNFIYTKEALVLAFQKGAAYAEQSKIEYGTGSHLAVMDQLYGSKSVRLSEGKKLDKTTVLGAAESPFIYQIG